MAELILRPADSIVAELGLPYDRTNISIRNEIKEMRRDHGKLIGSSNKGFFINEDLNLTIHHLQNRIRETNTIIERLNESFQTQN
jgi:hypothetical protein